MLRFAPRYGRISPCLVQPWQVRHGIVRRRPANDNVPAERPAHWQENDATLSAALRLFASHGFAAAAQAADAAVQAQAGGDVEKARWWMGVCRTLDRRMARGLQGQR